MPFSSHFNLTPCMSVCHWQVWSLQRQVAFFVFLTSSCITGPSCWTFGGPTKRWNPEESLPVQVDDVTESFDQITLPTPEGPFYRHVGILLADSLFLGGRLGNIYEGAVVLVPQEGVIFFVALKAAFQLCKFKNFGHRKDFWTSLIILLLTVLFL